MAAPRVTVEVRVKEAEALEIMAREVREGLTRVPKEIPSKHFYDERGSHLFEEITLLPEYYLTRAEQALLARKSAEIARVTRPETLIELGPGSARKTRMLLEAGMAIGTLLRYVPVEVAAGTAERSARQLAEDYPWLAVNAIVEDFERDLEPLPPGGARLVAFLGSTIGNFVQERAAPLLGGIAKLLDDRGWFLLGTDLVKDKETLEAAYNDKRGVTAEFNRNILRVVNRRFDGDFEPEAFEHVAFYDENLERIEMHLEALRPQHVRLGGIDLEIDVERGERIRTEVSCKYRRETVESLLGGAGLSLEHWYEGGGFALSLSRRGA
jgi:L-histidine N-alpha-methyltransferase